MNAVAAGAIGLLTEMVEKNKKNLIPLLIDALTDLGIKPPSIRHMKTVTEYCYEFHHVLVMAGLFQPEESPVWKMAERFSENLEKMWDRLHRGSLDILARQRFADSNGRMVWLSRKERAAMTRSFCTAWGLKPIQVQTPDFAFAMTVDIRFPGRPRRDYRGWECDKLEQGKEWFRVNSMMEQLLVGLFPGTEDRSEPMSNYYAASWSINQWN